VRSVPDWAAADPAKAAKPSARAAANDLMETHLFGLLRLELIRVSL
jgi:hypothetical protein